MHIVAKKTTAAAGGDRQRPRSDRKQAPRAVLYLRSACSSDAASSDVIARQRQACEQRARELGVEPVREYVDRDQGRALSDLEHGFQHAGRAKRDHDRAPLYSSSIDKEGGDL